MNGWGVLASVVVLTSGLAAGVLAGTLLGGFPLLAVLSAPRYVHAHRFLATRYDPFMPVCILTTVGGATALAAATAGPARVAYAIAAVAALLASAVSLRKNVPINRALQHLDPDRLPTDFDAARVRRTWGRWNTVRTALAGVAFAACSAAVAVQLS